MKVRILYPHNIHHSGFELEPLVALQSVKTTVCLVNNHRLTTNSKLDLWGLVDATDFLGWYPVYMLAYSKLDEMLKCENGTVFKLQNAYSEEPGHEGWRMVDFKKVPIEAALNVINRFDVHFHLLRKKNEYLLA